MESYSKLRFSLNDVGFFFAGKARKAFVLARIPGSAFPLYIDMRLTLGS